MLHGSCYSVPGLSEPVLLSSAVELGLYARVFKGLDPVLLVITLEPAKLWAGYTLWRRKGKPDKLKLSGVGQIALVATEEECEGRIP